MPETLQPVFSKFVVASAAQTSTTTTASITLPLADSYTFIQDVTAASGTSPTLDTALQISPDGGTTFYSVMRFAQVTTTNQQRITFQPIQGRGEASSQAALADTGGQVTANQPISTIIKFKFTIGGTSPSFTVQIAMFAAPRATAV